MTDLQLQRPDPGSISRRTGDHARVPARPDRSIPAQYDRLLCLLTAAEQELEADGSGGRSGHLADAAGIVFDLLYALNLEDGGELVPRLAALYGYIGSELLNVERTRDPVQLGHLRDMITTLKHSW